ncbi:MAG: hypothetical protein ACOYMS_05320 [Terrimicrobiaceae bacterium]
MRVLPKILPGILLLAALFGALLLVERLTTQELTRLSDPETQQTVCLIWKPRLLRGDGLCVLELLNAQSQVTDSVKLGILDTAFNALQQFGGLGFHGDEITVTNLRTGDLVQRFKVRNHNLQQHPPG